jgi:peptidoglycan/LPS O-acetylase OafA/YrhL
MTGEGVLPSHLQHHLKKNDALQILRAIAALLVVYAHSIDVVKETSSPRQAHFYFLENFGACGVDIFFAISGFILSTAVLRMNPETPRKAFDFIARRYIRIFPIYWILSLVPFALAIKWHQPWMQQIYTSALLLPSFSYPMLAPFLSIAWTLIFEMFFYYTLSLNLLFGLRRVIERVLLTIFLLIGLGALIGLHHPVIVLISNPISLEFAMGCAIALAYQRFGHSTSVGNMLLITGAVALCATIFLGYREADDANYVLNGALSWYRVGRWGVPAAILTAGVIFRPGEVRSAFGRFCVYLGDASYSIYLTSVITLMIYARFYRFVAHFPADLNVFTGVGFVMVVGTASYSFIERPVTQFVSALYRKHGAPPVRTAVW